ncbi:MULTISPECIES: glycosyltransferase family 10 domain-containing protein [Helicobacter]|uniref:Glycosyltransferase family 10 n=1 Tax=Helicobacter ibis TaxID=2962633 RepID=A0ABT4VFT0_9HELI|nr:MULTISPECIES: glycosyltransferase family 10 [Helicobacter]MDA3966383.1 glycosyltransferase family 10 [Helicobacter sp. WB40]MDA3969003.1 glycosyltransferase family 10 [Helicobacter ibis]
MAKTKKTQQISKKKIKLRIVDWWNVETEENFWKDGIIKKINEKFEVEYSNEPDFLIYGPYGYRHINFSCPRIFVTYENVRTNWNIADYGIDFDYMSFGDRHERICYIGALGEEQRIVLNPKLKRNYKKTKFCGFMATNSGWGIVGLERDKAFDEISKYKQVDSGGNWRNNIGGAVGNRWGDDVFTSKINWLKDYKFNLCFENSSYAGYTTERIFDAFIAGCIPIYWGDPVISGFGDDRKSDFVINPKAFINALNYPTLKDMVEDIKRIDSDDKLFKEMINEPIFLEVESYEYYNNRIYDFIFKILDQDPKDAYRRGEGQFLYMHENFYKKAIEEKSIAMYVSKYKSEEFLK